MVREPFEIKKPCIIFFDQVDVIGGARFDDATGSDDEVQRTMLELINQVEGYDPRDHYGDKPVRSSSIMVGVTESG